MELTYSIRLRDSAHEIMTISCAQTYPRKSGGGLVLGYGLGSLGSGSAGGAGHLNFNETWLSC